ncbi:MAG: MBL fold metallo-hydrolase [Anaerolineae bacterium]|nr:MBL fold metallo-hydrolase [Thermoflexales bacterium]MDW8407172.1 MBL fold metallo-hydrolase [Anaerolineae bacterium]
MEITWHGLSCFRLTDRGMLTVVTDPYEPAAGETLPKLKADVITVSRDEPGYSNVATVVGAQRGDVRVLRGAGEFEMGGVFITGVAMRPEKRRGDNTPRSTVFSYYYDGVNVVNLGQLPFVPTQAQIDALDTVDVLLLPVGGGDSLNAVQASEVVALIEPSIVVPMNFKTNGISPARKLDGVGKFLKEMGLAEVKPQESLKVTKGSLPEDTQVVVLEVRQ